MERSICWLMPMLLVAGSSGGQTLIGRGIILDTQERLTLDTPICLPWAGLPAEGDFEIVDQDAGKSFPGTLHAGSFFFVIESVAPSSTHRYRIAGVAEGKPPGVDVRKHDDRDQLDVRINGGLFTSYHYANDVKKPYLWPVLGEGGASVTRDWPMGEAEKTEDHPHHRSLWSGYGDLNGTDCWTEGDGTGWQHSDEVTWGSGAALGWIKAKNTWQDAHHKAVVAEGREYRFYATRAERRLIDVRITFTAAYGDVRFKDTKEGGIVAVRVRDALRVDQHGAIANSAGGRNERGCWGKPAAWADYSGAIEGAGVRGIAVFDQPSNFGHPSHWHVRNYGLMAANCFGLGAFTKGKENGDYTLKAGDSLTFNYRVFVHSGDAAKAAVADRYADYADPPRAAWTEQRK